MGKHLKNRPSLIVLLCAGIAAVLGCWWYFRRPPAEFLHAALAKAFNRNAEFIELNLPPAEGRYPGTVLTNPNPGQVAPIRRMGRPTIVPAASTLTVNLTSDAAAQLSSSWLSLASAGDLSITMLLEDLRIFDVNINQEFKASLCNDADVVLAAKQQRNVRVITCTYEAKVSIEIKKGSSLSAEAWKEQKNTLSKAGGSLTNKDALLFTGESAIPIAYEIMSIDKFISDHFDPDTPPTDVKLSPTRRSTQPLQPVDLGTFKMHPAATKTLVAAIGTEAYASTHGDLPAVPPSLELVSHVFRTAGMTPARIDNAHLAGRTKAALEESLDQVAQQASAQGAEAIVLYYVGHAVAGKGGHLHLVLGDFQGSVQKALGEDLFLGLPRWQAQAPGAPAQGSNLTDLLDAVNAIQGEFPDDIKGLYPVSALAKKLAQTGKPVALLIDGCFGHKGMSSLRDALHLTPRGDYSGPNLTGADAAAKYQAALRQFSVAPYLRDSNVIVFSAAPGTLAQTVSDPRKAWELSPKVGPLAARLYRRFETAVAGREALSCGAFFQSVSDIQRTGEWRTFGTVSWSDFDAWKGKPMLASAE